MIRKTSAGRRAGGASPTLSLAKPLTDAIPHALVTTAATGNSEAYAIAVLVIWLSGALLTAAWFSIRQWAFLRSLEPMTSGADGALRSDRIGAPMLVGAWRPRVVVPADFECRYPDEDRVLMLAHEHAHRARGEFDSDRLAVPFLV